jgi:uncharacterized protein involved in oxidation of intracellular sulfur
MLWRSTNASAEIFVFLMADSVIAARKGQKTPEGYYNVERMLGRVLAGKGSVLLCGTCMDARGMTDADVLEGARRSSMDELATTTLAADKRHSGAPVSVFVGFDRSAYTVTKGEIAKFASSPGTVRGFCRTCGSRLTCETTKLPSEAHFHVGAFDEPARLEPTIHVVRKEQLLWLHLP